MKYKTFETLDNRLLVVKNKKAVVYFELGNVLQGYDFSFKFDAKVFKELIDYLEECSAESWSEIKLRDATSEASDYYEYYDKEFDNNGYLGISTMFDNCLTFERPVLESLRLYKFNKRKMETFLYDLKKLAVKND